MFPLLVLCNPYYCSNNSLCQFCKAISSRVPISFKPINALLPYYLFVYPDLYLFSFHALCTINFYLYTRLIYKIIYFISDLLLIYRMPFLKYYLTVSFLSCTLIFIWKLHTYFFHTFLVFMYKLLYLITSKLTVCTV